MPGYVNVFVKPDHYEHEIESSIGGGKIGLIRLKPNRVLWKPKSQRQYYSVSLDEFVAWITDPQTGATRTKS
jgi:hypothetical protein